jgi:hypothetical protein
MNCLIGHLCDDDWVVRLFVVNQLEPVAKAGIQSQTPLKTMPKSPFAMAYIIADRSTLIRTQAAWQKWWSANDQQILGTIGQAALSR